MSYRIKSKTCLWSFIFGLAASLLGLNAYGQASPNAAGLGSWPTQKPVRLIAVFLRVGRLIRWLEFWRQRFRLNSNKM